MEPKFITSEDIAFNKYYTQRNKLSKKMLKHMNKLSRKEHLSRGLISATIAGVVFSVVPNKAKANVTQQSDNNDQIIEYKVGNKTMNATMFHTLSLALLVGLGISGVKMVSVNTKNRDQCETLVNDTLERYFAQPLKYYIKDPQMRFRTLRAIAFIINNMPQSDIARLHSLAISELSRDSHGHYFVKDHAVDQASKIISEFIDQNPEVGYNIVRIMHGVVVKTFMLPMVARKIR